MGLQARERKLLVQGEMTACIKASMMPLSTAQSSKSSATEKEWQSRMKLISFEDGRARFSICFLDTTDAKLTCTGGSQQLLHIRESKPSSSPLS